jgi:hypothetical protein
LGEDSDLLTRGLGNLRETYQGELMEFAVALEWLFGLGMFRRPYKCRGFVVMWSQFAFKVISRKPFVLQVSEISSTVTVGSLHRDS